MAALRLALIAALLGALLLGWTLLRGEPAPEVSVEPPVEIERPAPSRLDAYLDLLALVPAARETRARVLLNDYERAVEALGLVRPGPEAERSEVLAYAERLDRAGLAPGPYVSGFDASAAATLDALRANAGYDLRDVALSLSAGEPPEAYSALALQTASDKIRRTLIRNTRDARLEAYAGAPVLRWGGEFDAEPARRLRAPMYDSLGRGAKLAFLERTLLYTVWTQGLYRMLDARAGELDALADDVDLRALARGLAELGAFSALLSDRTQSARRIVQARGDPGLAERLAAQPQLAGYEAFAVGLGRDEAGPFVGLVLIHDAASDAQANAARLASRLRDGISLSALRPWRERFDPERATIWSEGRALSAKLRFAQADPPPRAWLDWVYEHDPLLLHE